MSPVHFVKRVKEKQEKERKAEYLSSSPPGSAVHQGGGERGNKRDMNNEMLVRSGERGGGGVYGARSKAEYQTR